MYRFIHQLVLCAFVLGLFPFELIAQSVQEISLVKPGTLVRPSSVTQPVILQGLRINPANPLQFDFILNQGKDKSQDLSTKSQMQLKEEADRLIKYFFAALAVPQGDLWVNLSPYEKDRIIPPALGQTILGVDMLAQDYLLKQFSASMIHPQSEFGKKFWHKVNQQIQQQYGHAMNIPIETFHKVWIIADRAKVYVHGQTAFIVDAHLKVMMEDDYLAGERNGLKAGEYQQQQGKMTNIEHPASDISQYVYKEIILPLIESEVNQGEHFAPLRQIFHSIILANWFEKHIKRAVLNRVYSNKNLTEGLSTTAMIKYDEIYQLYLKAYKKGVFNFIKEDEQSNQKITRKYFSGGVLGDLAMQVSFDRRDRDVLLSQRANWAQVSVNVLSMVDNRAMVSIDDALEEWDQGELIELYMKIKKIQSIRGVLSEFHTRSNAENKLELAQWLRNSIRQQYLRSSEERNDSFLISEVEIEILRAYFYKKLSKTDPSYMPKNVSFKEGLSIGLDHSGTNINVVLMYTDKSGKRRVLGSVNKKWEAFNDKPGYSIKKQPFAEIAKKIRDVVKALLDDSQSQVKQLGIDIAKEQIPLFYGFGFQMDQSAINKAKIIKKTVSKGWEFPDSLNEDVLTTLNNALDSLPEGYPKVKANGIGNDTLATQYSGSVVIQGKSRFALLGAIVGTGFNETGPNGDNTEAGKIRVLENLWTNTDRQFWANIPNDQVVNELESFMTGEAVMAKINLIIGQLFPGRDKQLLRDLFADSKNFYVLLGDVLTSKGKLSQATQQIQNAGVNQEEYSLLYNQIKNFMDRSTQLFVEVLLADLEHITFNLGEIRQEGGFINLDGSTFWRTPGYKENVARLLVSRSEGIIKKVVFIEKSKDSVDDQTDQRVAEALQPGVLVFVERDKATAQGAAILANIIDSVASASMPKKQDGLSPNQAMNAQNNQQAFPGGIDFNQVADQIQQEGENIHLQIDDTMIKDFETLNLKGINPVITAIVPLESIAPLL